MQREREGKSGELLEIEEEEIKGGRVMADWITLYFRLFFALKKCN